MKTYLLVLAIFSSSFSFSGSGLSTHSKAEDDKSNIEDDKSNIEDGEPKIDEDGKGFFRHLFAKNTHIKRKKVYEKVPATDKDDQEEMILYKIDPEGVPRLMPCVGDSLELFHKAACQRIEMNNEGKLFNEYGAVYTQEEINDIHLNEVFNAPLEKYIKYANQRTYAFPDLCQELRTAAIENNQSRLTNIDKISVTDLANLAYVSLFAMKEENKKSALDIFNRLKDQLQKKT